jgi:hypothetical protein
MAIRANHIALGDLGLQGLHARCVILQVADVVDLLCWRTMIEFHDVPRVLLAAIDARSILACGNHRPPSLSLTDIRLGSPSLVRLLVRLVMATAVVADAIATLRLELPILSTLEMETVDGQLTLAGAASLGRKHAVPS